MNSGEERRARLAQARLYLCTGVRPDLEAFLDAVLGAGVDIVQLREKTAGVEVIADAAKIFRAAADRHGALFVLNDDPELALAVGADGVHVGQEDMSPDAARSIAGAEVLVGRSTHSPDEIARAQHEPVDYLGVGPVNETPTKPGRPGVGVELVRHAARSTNMPFFVTGGMSAATITGAMRAGAQRFVVVRAITEADDPAAAVREIIRAMSGVTPTRAR